MNDQYDINMFAKKLSLRVHIKNKLQNLDEKHKWIKNRKYLDSLFNVMVDGIDITNKNIGKDNGIIVFYDTDYKQYTNTNLNCWLLYNFIDKNKGISKDYQQSIYQVGCEINEKYKDVDLSKAVSDIEAYNEALGLGE